MDKLNELLDEYIEEKDFGDNLNEYNEAEIIDEETLEVNGDCHDIEYLYTKKFGFIKWLVENDKIDREKFGNSETKSSKYSDFDLSYNTPREDYINTLLMELAIQDEPIQFLIRILR